MHLLKRDSTYYFRQRIPAHFDTIKQTHIKVSLRTKTLKIAKLRANLLSFRLDNLFIKRRVMDLKAIREIINTYIKEAIEEYSELETLRHNALAFIDQDGKEYGGHTPQAIDKELAILHELSYSDNVEMLEQKAELILPRTNITQELITTLDSHKKHIFNHELIKGEYQILLHDKEKTQSRLSEEDTTFEAINGVEISPKLLKSLTKTFGQNNALELLNAYTKVDEPQHLFSECIERYIENEYLARGWKPKTIVSNRAKLNLALKIMGDKDIKDYTRADFEAYRTVLLKLPTNMNKIPQYKDKSIQELTEMNKASTLTKRTINEYITSLSAMIEWAIIQGYLINNITKNLKLKIPRKNRDDRLPFNPEEIRIIFEAIKPFQTKKPHLYYVTFIGLYNGLRLNEICQLHIEDIKKVKDIWCFDINEDINSQGELVKSVKNEPSKRIVPMHPKLVELGFLDYYRSIVTDKHTRVFPLLTKQRDGYGKVITNFFTKLQSSMIANQNKKVFHSTRHNFIQKLKNARVDDHLRKAITGRSDDDIDYDSYGDGILLEELLEAVQKVSYPELEHSMA
ncbi:site-specific integrase [Sulfurospirillum barnesii]|uniref:Site-specific recombinase XerD n=1 Tax=Sulfurospirillum barnesii (strain ATCC 700032 / DSM 10660 / SES-3) TaxID=760154 RepID=I3XZL5_SULBS|nr:site-specific integrase [Sulfurospirillum barnesii]AFL69389.1 site-specific recombinase XerD [Sulfurospirillum barnesii SES-3]